MSTVTERAAVTAVGTFRRSSRSRLCDFPLACWLFSADSDRNSSRPWSPEHPAGRSLPAGAGVIQRTANSALPCPHPAFLTRGLCLDPPPDETRGAGLALKAVVVGTEQWERSLLALWAQPDATVPPGRRHTPRGDHTARTCPPFL